MMTASVVKDKVAWCQDTLQAADTEDMPSISGPILPYHCLRILLVRLGSWPKVPKGKMACHPRDLIAHPQERANLLVRLGS